MPGLADISLHSYRYAAKSFYAEDNLFGCICLPVVIDDNAGRRRRTSYMIQGLSQSCVVTSTERKYSQGFTAYVLDREV